jgi:hypothetical protein
MDWTPPDARRPAGVSAVAAARGATPALRRWRADLVVFAFTVGCTVLLGAPVGLVWSALAPHAHVAVEAGGAYIADVETEVFIAGDGWFIGLTLLIGVGCGVLAWLVARRSGPFVVVGLAVGGLIAAYVASRVGVRIGQDSLRALVRSGRPGTYVGNIALQAKAAFVIWPLGAVSAFAVLVASRVDELE